MDSPSKLAETALFVLPRADVSNSPRVLIADDDPDLLTTIADALALQGYGVVRAESGAALVDQLANEGPFDLIVTDVLMPWMDGLEAIRTLRTAGLATPVILMTALRDAQLSTQVQALSPAILLHKPFGLNELEAAVVTLTS